MLNPSKWVSTSISITIKQDPVLINLLASRNLTLTAYNNLCPVCSYRLLQLLWTKKINLYSIEEDRTVRQEFAVANFAIRTASSKYYVRKAKVSVQVTADGRHLRPRARVTLVLRVQVQWSVRLFWRKERPHYSIQLVLL